MFCRCSIDVLTHAHPNAIAFVDVDDYEKLSFYKWHTDRTGYIKRSQNINGVKVKILMHRVILGVCHGRWLTTLMVIHQTTENVI